MEKDKLEIAANQYEEESIYGGMEALYDTKYAFKQGTEWLMGQPIADRLNTEDVDKLNNILFLMRGMAASHQMSYDCLKHISNAIYDVFGKEIFEKQSRYAVVNKEMFENKE